MFPWKFVCIAAVALVIVLAVKIALLYQGVKEIGGQFHDRLSEDTNNVIYVSGNDRHLKAFARQLNQELKILYDQRRRYQNGDKELKEAVTNISHDLRTPLTAIYGYLELAEAEMEAAEVLEAASPVQELGDSAPREWSRKESPEGAAPAASAQESGRNILRERSRKESPESAISVPERERASQRLQSTEQMTHYLAQIRNRADAMCALTEELFRYSIILSASGKHTGYQQAAVDTGEDSGRERVVLNRFLADCLLSYYDIFTQNRIEPRIAIADEEIVRFLDAGALRRIFCNILDNAVKYSKPAMSPERAVLTVELFPDGTITFGNSSQNMDWVSVERLFDRFYTVETGRNSTGLGLSIAKLLTERMGGSISAAYTEGMLEITVKF
ncbi:MAG: HAMP domain-containing histidine kinase [Lachnospiraceae bacterium]|nr:HAMP domain-containing histidine kinase [Lachnospiraceae bacterium]